MKEGAGEEVEEDEKGEKANVLIVEEEEEEQLEVNREEEKINQEAVKEEVANIQDVLDTLTLENKEEKKNFLPEEPDTLKELEPKEENLQEIGEQKADEKVEEKADEKVEEKADEKIEEKADEKAEEKEAFTPPLPPFDKKETRSRRSMMTNKENTPKLPKEGVVGKEGTPKIGTPVIKASKLGTPKLGTPRLGTPKLGTPKVSAITPCLLLRFDSKKNPFKTGKLGKLHPDDIESPRRVTRFHHFNYFSIQTFTEQVPLKTCLPWINDLLFLGTCLPS